MLRIGGYNLPVLDVVPNLNAGRRKLINDFLNEFPPAAEAGRKKSKENKKSNISKIHYSYKIKNAPLAFPNKNYIMLFATN